MERPSLNVVEGSDRGKVFHLDQKPTYTLGRGHSVDIPVMDIKCSREHCKVERRDDGYYLVDLGSSNGTRLNGKKLKKRSYRRLQPGDRVKLGYTVLTFRPGSESPAATAPAPKKRGRPRKAKRKPPTRTCADCRHWRPIGSDDGECRRHAPHPTVAPSGDTDVPVVWWPILPGCESCGEHERREGS